ncbi:BatD family protein [Xanthomonas translucens]|uniref:BatD family protein n=2 Tax=Xanthomonas campestris pv. translucens TaxID=343 RepID=UPI0012951325|nr:BatD family protein [Xanthomonas translucens]MCS3361470.1 BatD family protein [Xanthomonas translucens pv. translucens]MCS3374630.1 BatD family protein [Xanthomonas translucens pv. translucens]MCT8275683.1 BatD family protein [Xanthomonas translucens pv. translucens]MCT8279779.1 BatD family protein [Xanthomonas translucens pv. translucens]MCT8291054.1 BatD family protein [Xanthomonas translucens pv. translucens]
MLTLWAGLLLSALALPAAAATRAWLDRDSIGAGESVTLNIETDHGLAAPEYAPLRAQFALSDEVNSRQMQMVNGQVTAKSLFGVALTPRGTGTIEIPSLRVGNERTAPLRLQVAAAAPAPAGSTRGGDPAQIGNADVFVQTVADDAQPYVQQSVGVVVRLYLGVPLTSGELDLDPPAGAALQRIGDDVQSRREIDGRMFTIVERRYLLVPERSGPLTLPGARFRGRGPSGFFDDYFGRGGDLTAHSATHTLQVRAQPANAPQPWLPLHDLRLRYTATPQRAAVGEAADIVVEASARGATQAQFPELPTPSVDGAQVFAEPPQFDEKFVDGSPQLKITRRYSIVPQTAGPLRVGGLHVPWWDVAAGAAREATLPDLHLQVLPGRAAPAAPAAPTSVAAPSVDAAPAGNAVTPAHAVSGLLGALPLWMALAALFALLWLATLVWGWRRGRASRTPAGAHAAPAASAAASTAPRARYGLPDLRKALDGGGLDEVAAILCAQAGVADLDALLTRLDDSSQREAVLRLQRARWGDAGDVPGARAALRQAFWAGPRWCDTPRKQRKDDLPPLYPRDA